MYPPNQTKTLGPQTTAVDFSEWSRLPKPGQRLEGLCRSTIYAAINDGRVRSRSLKAHKHSLRGIRLVSISSLREMIAGADGQSLETVTA
jgi:hypothetical protein